MKPMMRARNMDQVLRLMVLDGAKLEPSQAHPSWSTPTDLGIYDTLRDRLDTEIFERCQGSDLVEADDLLQAEVTKVESGSTLFSKVGASMNPRLFQKSAKVLTTSSTLLLKWLTQRVVDQAKAYRTKDAYADRLKRAETERQEPRERPELSNVMLDEIVADTELGRELLALFPKTGCMAPAAEKFVSMMKDQRVYEGSLTDLARQFGCQVGTLSTYRHRIAEMVAEGLRRNPRLMAKLENAQQWA